MKINIKKYAMAMASLLGLLVILQSCNKDLNQTNPNAQTAQTFWKTATDAFNGGNSVYGSLILDGSYMRFTHVILNTRGDDATSQSPWNEIYNCGKFAEDVNGFAASAPYTAYYQGVFRANQVLNNVPGISMDTALKNRILGQTYFLRAFYFFHLADIYNNVPMPLTQDQATGNYYVRQTPRDSVFLQCISDFQKAASLLPVSYANVTGPDQESIFEVQFSRTVGGTADGWGPGDPDATWGKYEARAVTFGPRNFAYGDVQPTKALYYEFLQ
jgi:hypothetical protein